MMMVFWGAIIRPDHEIRPARMARLNLTHHLRGNPLSERETVGGTETMIWAIS